MGSVFRGQWQYLMAVAIVPKAPNTGQFGSLSELLLTSKYLMGLEVSVRRVRTTLHA